MNDQTATPATPATPAKIAPKFTSATRRGLRDVRALVLASFDDSAPPSATAVKAWTMKREREFNQALDWIDAKTAEGGAS